MMAKKIVALVLLLYVSPIFSHSFGTNSHHEKIELSKNLQLIKINEYSYIHISYITLENGNKFPCNGFVYTDKKEAYIFDSPANDLATKDLINWLQNEMKVHIKGVVFNHFHTDCTKGIHLFNKVGIASIASKKTTDLLYEKRNIRPDQLFDNNLELKVGNKLIYNRFFGEGHTKDNIVSYFPDENILFGGCLVKSLGGRKGNLEDANTNSWSTTVSSIKKVYPKTKVVIPGHGDYGDIELLTYTISLFKN